MDDKIKTFTQKQTMLTALDLCELIPAAKAGDSISMALLCEKFSPLVYKLSHRQTLFNILGEDAENTLWILFLEALNNFDSTRYDRFPGFVRKHLISRIINILKHNGYRFQSEQLTSLDYECEATQVPSADDLSYILNDIALKQELELLPIHQSYILKQFYCEHKSMEEISIALGMSQRTVRYHRQAGLKSLRIRLQVKSE
jgi:RNA polymerase sigma factor (sigma-70 family)